MRFVHRLRRLTHWLQRSRMDYAKSLIDRTVLVLMYDGRTMVGVLKGIDHQTTIVLTDCRERIFSETDGVEEVVLGLYIVRGDQICCIGELNDEIDRGIDWPTIKGSRPEAIIAGVL